jgi:hypothetical protein
MWVRGGEAAGRRCSVRAWAAGRDCGERSQGQPECGDRGRAGLGLLAMLLGGELFAV